MKFDLKKRSHSSRGGRLIAVIALGIICISSIFVFDTLGWIACLWFGASLVGALALLFWRAEEDEILDEDEIVEIAQSAMRSEAERLSSKKDELERVLMAYGEWMEFPDFDELRDINWATEARSEQDHQVGLLLAAESEKVIQRFSDGAYWEGGQFQHQLLAKEFLSFVEKIARVYQPDSERPLLETNLEGFLKALNRVSLQIILLLEELPLLDVKNLNIRKVSDQIRKATRAYKKYETVSPYLDPVRYIWQGSKFLFASNPLLAAGWIAGSELIYKGGKHVGKKMIDGYALSLINQTLGIIAWETASIYDRTHRYRNPDFVFAVELAHLVSCFELSRDTLHETLKVLGNIPLRSSYDRIFLYRCVAQHVSPKPERFAQAEILSHDTRETIAARLDEFFHKYVEEAREKDVINWERGLRQRLDLQAPA